MPRHYYRVMLGRQSVYAPLGFAGNFIGIDAPVDDLTGQLNEDWREFIRWFAPRFLMAFPERSRIAAGLAGGFVWTVTHGIRLGDIVLCPDGAGNYRVGEVTSGYEWAQGEPLPHRRGVRWLDVQIPRAEMSTSLRRSTGSAGTVAEVTHHADELQRLIGDTPVASAAAVATAAGAAEAAESAASFVMEKHLEDFLVQNWSQTELGQQFVIYSEEGAVVGQQYPTDTGPMDILAVSRDGTQLLVVELKKGRASDAVVGQVLRYMGYVQEELAEPGQTVRGVIVALEDDQRIRRALAMTPSIAFYRYEITFKLMLA